ncbi:hypothetical protein Trydic_g19032 [Trypoxylus dichotomus]
MSDSNKIGYVSDKQETALAQLVKRNDQRKKSTVQLGKLWNDLKRSEHNETKTLRHYTLAIDGGLLEKQILDPVLEVMEDAAPYLDKRIVCPWNRAPLLEKDIPIEEAAKPFIKLPVTVPVCNPASSSTEHKRKRYAPLAKEGKLGKRLAEEEALRVVEARSSKKRRSKEG